MPLNFDMPLEELYQYQGRNPQPADFEQFWDNSLADLNHIDPQVELIPADFQVAYAKCDHMYFTGTDGARVHAKLLQPNNVEGTHPAVLMFHGYAGNSGDWSDKLPYVAAGYTVAAMDCRGQGGRSEDTGGVGGWTLRGHIVRGLDDPPQNLLLRHLFLDTALMARIVMDMPEVDASRVGATGGSQGGGLTLACASLEPRIKLAAPVFPFLCDYQRVWEMDLAQNAYAELQEWFRRFDPLHERQDQVFTQLGYVDVQHLVPRIQAEVLMAVGLMDQICPPSTQFAAYNKITATKNLRLYPDYGHENLPANPDAVYQFFNRL